MPTITAETLLERLHWRAAIKKFDPARKIPADAWAALERAMILAPSSSGLQPWSFLVITDPATRQKLRAVSYNQAQITDASHLVVFCRRRALDAAYIERYIARMAHIRTVDPASLDGLRKSLLNTVANPAGLHGGNWDAWTSRQVYIALGFFLSAAAMLGIDACPMEGFDAAKYDEILGLHAKGLAATVIATTGYRAADDPFAAKPKVRWDAKDIVTHI